MILKLLCVFAVILISKRIQWQDKEFELKKEEFKNARDRYLNGKNWI